MSELSNEGVIKGKSISDKDYSGNGIGIYSPLNVTIGNINNNGVISGEGIGGTRSGNGISTYSFYSKINIINNSGIIKGATENGFSSGHGINGWGVNEHFINSINNSGVIKWDKQNR